MINFDAVDFSERRPEEVISFFWRSVYFLLYTVYTCIIFIDLYLPQSHFHTKLPNKSHERIFSGSRAGRWFLVI